MGGPKRNLQVPVRAAATEAVPIEILVAGRGGAPATVPLFNQSARLNVLLPTDKRDTVVPIASVHREAQAPTPPRDPYPP